ncbi:MAG: hypothetical protein AAF985_05450 [Bacteroidota bacterium]
MKINASLLGLIALCFSCSNSDNSPILNGNFTRSVQLDNQLLEISGILPIGESSLIGHNDSGDDPILYQFRLEDGVVEQRFTIDAQHQDWEEIAEDDDFIYVGDFGNNSGDRQNLRVYKIAKADLVADVEINAESILFHYPAQDNFSPRDDHNFDCEAMIALGDYLYLFSKNRGNRQTDLYRLPKVPGNHSAEWMQSFDSQGLVTAASIRKTDQPALALLAYEYDNGGFLPFIWLFSAFPSHDFFAGRSVKIDIPFQVQAESITFENSTQLIFAAESESGRSADFIYRLDASEWLQ